ncbi:MAG TPA: glycosyltransferase [Longimicrobiales bacterium]
MNPATIVTDLAASGDAFYVRMLARAVQRADAGLRFVRFRPSAMLTGRAPDVWHMHWPESVATSRSGTRAALDVAAYALSLRAARRGDTRIVWTVHNLAPHERLQRRSADRLMRNVVERLDGWISLTEAAVPLALDRFPALARLPRLVVPHGHYADVYPPAVERAEARSRLGIAPDARALLYFGNIRPYKNVPGLVRAFRAVADERAILLVAGAPYDARVQRDVEAAAAGDARIRLRLAHVPESEVPLLFGAADRAVLPAERILNSGSMVLSLSFGVPALAPSTPVLRELREQAGAAALTLFEPPLDAAALAAFLAQTPPEREPLIQRLRTAHDWNRIGSATARFYRSVMQAPRHG